ncbi:MAG: BatD family protein [Acidobacteriota bacterium]|nr:MAG: BatD family protein [Acidobacteriota bacterium]
MRLHVDVLVTTWLTRAPEYPELELDGALVLLPDERPRNLTERIEGQNWYGLSRSYLIYPQEPREYQTPAGEVIVRMGQVQAPVKLSLEPSNFRARIPPEARGLGYFVATRQLTLEQDLAPELVELKVGASIRRTISMSAEQTFAMFLPPVAFDPVAGLSVYPDPPRLENRTEDRVGFVGGLRQDSAVYVIQQPGTFHLPEIQLFWWDLDAGRMREARLPEVEFEATPNPDYVPEIPLPPEPETEDILPAKRPWWHQLRSLGLPLVLALLLAVVLVLMLPKWWRSWSARLAERRRLYKASEAAAFERLRQAVREGDAANIMRQLYQWLDRVEAAPGIPTLRALGRFSGDENLERELSILQSFLFAEPRGVRWEGSRQALLQGLNRLRRMVGADSGPVRNQAKRLPLLNPPVNRPPRRDRFGVL